MDCLDAAALTIVRPDECSESLSQLRRQNREQREDKRLAMTESTTESGRPAASSSASGMDWSSG